MRCTRIGLVLLMTICAASRAEAVIIKDVRVRMPVPNRVRMRKERDVGRRREERRPTPLPYISLPTR